jgi:2-oxo-4-hydroxy-4-carboxy-5-ureidoimidazoline decarboxylase
MSLHNETVSLPTLNQGTDATFIEGLGGMFENAPWIAGRAASQRPFATVADLFRVMHEAVERASEEEILALLRGHPELAFSGAMTRDSVDEQNAAGLDRLSGAQRETFGRLNKAYREKFGFPFILCVRRHGRDSILREFERRLGLSADQERETALAEVLRIGALRLDQRIAGPDRLPVAGRLSTHVLDTAIGRPAAGIEIEVFEVASDGQHFVGHATTNADGRTDRPLIGDRPVPIANYELRFHVGAYFQAKGYPLADPAFLDVVPIRFGVAEAEAHYHVPLLVSPWSYSTYRGS